MPTGRRRGRVPGPRPKGICPGCGELRALRDSGVLGMHNRLARGHYSIGVCKGVDQPAALFGPEPPPEVVIEVVVEPKVPEILAVRPSGMSTKIHLYIPGYQPGAKPRNPPDVGLCNGTGSIQRNELVPIAEALDWTKPHGPCDHCHSPRPDWHWCHLCLGRAIGVLGLADGLAKTIAATQNDLKGQTT